MTTTNSKTQFLASERLSATKRPGWEIPLRDKFWLESFRDRSGEEGLICARPPLLFTDPYSDSGKEYLHNPRYKGQRFICRHEKTGVEGLFSYITSFGVGAEYEPVDLCMQRLMRQQRKRKTTDQKAFRVPGLIKVPYKDFYLLEVDSTMTNDFKKQKIVDRENERMSRINYLRTAPLQRKNPSTHPTDSGTYGCIRTTISPFPGHMIDEYGLAKELQKKERETNEKLLKGRAPFISKPNIKPEHVFTTYRNLLSCDIAFPVKYIDVKPRFEVPWKYNSPPQKGNSGYSNITISRYPTYVVPGKKDIPKSTKIDKEWHSGGNRWWKPSPSIALFPMNVLKKR